MIVITKKLFCLILMGLASLAVASVCSILQLPMSKAVLLFLVTWVALIALFEIGTFPHSANWREPPDHK